MSFSEESEAENIEIRDERVSVRGTSWPQAVGICDADLLAAVRNDQAASITRKEYRKAWAKLRLAQRIRVRRGRVLRLIRDVALLLHHCWSPGMVWLPPTIPTGCGGIRVGVTRSPKIQHLL